MSGWRTGGHGGGGRRGAQGNAAAPWQTLQALTTDVVVFLPVFVLAEGAAVASCVAAAARLAGFPATVPATLTRVFLLVDDR